MFADMQKFFTPEAFTKAMQTSFNMTQANAMAQSNFEAFQKATTIWSETMASCMEKQMQMAQKAMEESVTCARDLSTASTMEELMSKNAAMYQKAAHTTQKNSQDIVDLLQKGQAKAQDVMQKQFAANISTLQTQTEAASKAASK